jgi:hypothetical protein
MQKAGLGGGRATVGGEKLAFSNGESGGEGGMLSEFALGKGHGNGKGWDAVHKYGMRGAGSGG